MPKMNEKVCKCEEIKRMGRIVSNYLRSLQDCVLQDVEIKEKDHHDIRELLKQADKMFK